MSKTTEIREICGDYAFDVEYSKDNVFTMMFNSRRNAETVKRCIEVDDSVPNVATPVDFVEVVRCKDCKYYDDFYHHRCTNSDLVDSDDCYAHVCLCDDDFCSCGEKKG